MALAAPARIRLKEQIAAALEGRDEADVDLILSEYGLNTGRRWNDDRTDRQYIYAVLASANDATLTSLAEFVAPVQFDLPSGIGPWKTHGLRLFISHTHHHREFVAEVRQALERFGIEGFVAHMDIEPTAEWMMAMEAALRTCDALAAFLHEEFRASKWCDQEVGVAYARQIPLIPVRLQGNDPHGFLGKYQALAGDGRTASQLAEAILGCLDLSPTLSDKLTDSLLLGLEQAQSFADAKDLTSRLQKRQPQWTAARLEGLRRALGNTQVDGAWGAGEWVRETLDAHTPRMPAADDVPF